MLFEASSKASQYEGAGRVRSRDPYGAPAGSGLSLVLCRTRDKERRAGRAGCSNKHPGSLSLTYFFLTVQVSRKSTHRCALVAKQKRVELTLREAVKCTRRNGMCCRRRSGN